MSQLIHELRSKVESINLQNIQDSLFDVVNVPSCQKCCAAGNGGNGSN